MDDRAKVEEAIFWIEKALDGFSAPEEIHRRTRNALHVLKDEPVED